LFVVDGEMHHNGRKTCILTGRTARTPVRPLVFEGKSFVTGTNQWHCGYVCTVVLSEVSRTTMKTKAKSVIYDVFLCQESLQCKVMLNMSSTNPFLLEVSTSEPNRGVSNSTTNAIKTIFRHLRPLLRSTFVQPKLFTMKCAIVFAFLASTASAFAPLTGEVCWHVPSRGCIQKEYEKMNRFALPNLLCVELEADMTLVSHPFSLSILCLLLVPCFLLLHSWIGMNNTMICFIHF
jgi:hypothetical protein